LRKWRRRTTMSEPTEADVLAWLDEWAGDDDTPSWRRRFAAAAAKLIRESVVLPPPLTAVDLGPTGMLTPSGSRVVCAIDTKTDEEDFPVAVLARDSAERYFWGWYGRADLAPIPPEPKYRPMTREEVIAARGMEVRLVEVPNDPSLMIGGFGDNLVKLINETGEVRGMSQGGLTMYYVWADGPDAGKPCGVLEGAK
jgi:hypothetical protein